MREIIIKSNGQTLDAGTLVSVNATVDTMECVFELDEFWDEYEALIANFANRSARLVVTVPIVNGRCRIPEEVLHYKGVIEVAIKGSRDTKVERSKPVAAVRQTETILEGDNAIDPTPDQYAQYIAEAGSAIHEYFDAHKDEFKGDPGYTPVKGIDYFDGQPGAPGEPGYTPRKGIDYFDGAPGEPGQPGQPGQPGEPGKTPVKGVDYFTDAEIDAITQPIEEELSRQKESLNQKVGFTDWANASSGGVLKISGSYGLNMADGLLRAQAMDIATYNARNLMSFISKGTLENVLAERLKEPQFELIESITLDNDAYSITRTAEPNGTPYNLKGVMVTTNMKASSGSTYLILETYFNDTTFWYGGSNTGIYTAQRSAMIKAIADRGFWNFESVTGSAVSKSAFGQYGGFPFDCDKYPVATYPSIKKIIVRSYQSTILMPKGSIINIYGIRA